MYKDGRAEIGDVCTAGGETYQLVKQPEDVPQGTCKGCAGSARDASGAMLCGALGTCYAWSKEGKRITCVWVVKS